MATRIIRSLRKPSTFGDLLLISQGADLAAAFNEEHADHSKKSQRVKVLVMKLAEVIERAAELPPPDFVPSRRLIDNPRFVFSRTIAKETAFINATLRRYAWTVQLSSFGLEGRPIFTDHPTDAPEGCASIRSVIDLAKAGLLDRLRRCAYCRLWFFGIQSNAAYCSAPCRQQKYRSKPKVKARTRKYAREYYRNWISPKTAKHLQTPSKRRKQRGNL